MLGGAGVLVVGRYVVAALGWAGTLIVVRQLSVSDFGRYQLILSILGIVGFIADLKLSRIVLRDLMAAEGDAAGDIVGSYVGLRLVIGVRLVRRRDGVGRSSAATRRTSSLGTAVAGLNLIILSAAFGVILLFEARLWLRDIAIGRTCSARSCSSSFTIAVAVVGIASILWFSWSTVANSIALDVLARARRAPHGAGPDPRRVGPLVGLAAGGRAARARRGARHRLLPHRHRDARRCWRPTPRSPPTASATSSRTCSARCRSPS